MNAAKLESLGKDKAIKACEKHLNNRNKRTAKKHEGLLEQCHAVANRFYWADKGTYEI